MRQGVFLVPIFLLCFIATIFIQFFLPLVSYGLLILLISILSFRKGLIDYRVGFLGMITLYSMYPLVHYFIYNNHDVGIGSYNRYALLEILPLNLRALQYISYFCLGICLHIMLRKNKFLECMKDLNQNNLKLTDISKYNLQLYISYILFFLSLLLLDWGRIRAEYTLEGISLTFFICYFIFSIYGIFIASTGKLTISKIIPLFLIMSVFAFMGTRQTIFWGILILFISNIIFLSRNPRSWISKSFLKSLIKYLFIITGIVTIFALTVSYRVNKDLGLIYAILGDIPIILKLSFSLFLSEVYYTYYNLLIVINSSLEGYLPLLSLFNDFFIQMIPSQLFPGKYAYMDFVNLSRDFELTPFGTWYIIGMIATVSIIPIMSMILGFLYCELINFISILLKKTTSHLGEFSAFYAIIYVFCSFYPVRATIAGGLKMALSIFIIFASFKLIPVIYKSIQVYNGRMKYLHGN